MFLQGDGKPKTQHEIRTHSNCRVNTFPRKGSSACSFLEILTKLYLVPDPKGWRPHPTENPCSTSDRHTNQNPSCTAISWIRQTLHR